MGVVVGEVVGVAVGVEVRRGERLARFLSDLRQLKIQKLKIEDIDAEYLLAVA